MPAQVIDGDVGFSRGMDSVTDAETLPPQSYTLAVNMLNRGGALQTRPGYKRMFTLPAGQLQGLKVFTPRYGIPSLLAIVSGVCYASTYPFRSYRTVAGAHLSPDAKQAHSALTTKAVQKNPDGSSTLITPKVLMILQDGINPAISYDGRVTVKESGVPQGTHMAWAGARLWVARREQVFAGDIADPTAFTEQTYNTLGGIQSFLLSGHCTGLAPLPSSSSVKTPLIAFTNSVTTMFQANVLDRSQWPSVPDFQSDLFPTLGNVAPRSILSHSGMLWWQSDFGQVRLDTASNTYITSKIDFRDREMTRSSYRMNSDMSGICAGAWENFILTSVPYADTKNRHTWVHDSSTNDLAEGDAPSAWASIWTGINPVEWAAIKVDGKTRLFVASKDDDGVNRVYETFTSLRRDNCSDIPWAWETRAFIGGSKQRKSFRYVEYALSDIAGQLDMNIKWAGANRGPWKSIGAPTFVAQEGNIVASRSYGPDEVVYALKKQSRVAKSEDAFNKEADSLASSGIEGPIFRTELEKEVVDTSFILRFEGSGQVAFRAIRLFADVVPEPDSGMQSEVETSDHFVRFDGAAAKTEETLAEAEPETFTATKTATVRVHNYSATATATVVSTISQSDVDKRATQVATCIGESHLSAIAAPHVGTGPVLPCATTPTGLAQVNGEETYTTVTIVWDPPVGDEEVFYLQVALDAGFTEFVTGYTGLELPESPQTLVITGLSASTDYYARLSSYCASDDTESAFTETVGLITSGPT